MKSLLARWASDLGIFLLVFSGQVDPVKHQIKVQRYDQISRGARAIEAERQRQIEEEGYTPEHDAAHGPAVLLEAAIDYAQHASPQLRETPNYPKNPPPHGWPWGEDAWKPSEDPILNLEKAGALIAAEIDRTLLEREDE